jgi:phosphatidylglycerophosphatase A
MTNQIASWKKWVASGGGSGYLPIAPATWGSAVALFPLLVFYGRADFSLHTSIAILSVAGLLLGVKLAAELEPHWGDDPKEFVWDEVVGMWLTMIGHALNGQNMLIGFFLFRFFDIFKPLGIRRLERLRNGWGVMMDDVAAGLVANLCLFGLEWFWAT